MTISSTTRKAGPFTGDGVVVAFPFAFKVFTAADLLVVQTTAGVDTTKALTTDYTVTLNADQNASPGGSVTMLVSPPVGSTLTLTSQVANTQGTDLTNLGGFFPKTITDALDRATIQIQQLAGSVSRVLQLPISSTASGALPPPVANTFLGWDNLAATIINYAGLASAAVSSAMAPVVAAATLALARIAMGITSAIQNQTDTAFTTAGILTAYTLTPDSAIAAYAANQTFFIKFHVACGAAPTLAISGLAAPPNLVKQNADGTYSNLAAGEVPINHRSRVTLISTTQAWVETLPDVSLGRGQTVQNVTASRSLSTVFTNSTGRPIFVHVRIATSSASATSVTLTVGGVTFQGTDIANSGFGAATSAIVPAGATYSAVAAGGAGTLNQWIEVR